VRNRIWPWFDGEYRAHVSAEQYHEMMKWEGVAHASVYTYPGSPKRYDIQFPKRLLGRVKKRSERENTQNPPIAAQGVTNG